MTLSAEHRAVLKKGLRSIPNFPVVVEQLSTLAAEEEPDIQAIVNTLKTDAGLTARVLRVVNSPFFGLTATITDMEHAVVMLGIAEIQNLAISVMLLNQQGKNTEIWDARAAKRFWRHSLAVACATKLLARTLPGCPFEGHAFAGGILHDVGKIVMARCYPQHYPALLEQRGMPLHAVEKALLGIDHAQAGEALCQHWRLPAPLVAAVAGHIEPQDEAFSLPHLILVANGLAVLSGFSGLGKPSIAPSFFDACRKAGLTQNSLTQVIQSLAGEVKNVIADFQLGKEIILDEECQPRAFGIKVQIDLENQDIEKTLRLMLASLGCSVGKSGESCQLLLFDTVPDVSGDFSQPAIPQLDIGPWLNTWHTDWPNLRIALIGAMQRSQIS